MLGNTNGRTYYGTVCSLACLYALGIDEAYHTVKWHTIPGMQLIPHQSINGLKLGDTICTKTIGHVVMVTGIERDSSGNPQYITICEAISSKVVKKKYTVEQFIERFPTSNNYYWRYARISEVKLRTSDISNAVQELEAMTAKDDELVIIPKKGDKSNWLEGSTIELDILDPVGYSGIEVYKDGTFFGNYDLTDTLVLKGLNFGTYKARLTDGENDSRWCEWMVVDAKTSVKENAVHFSCSNATPLFAIWCTPDLVIMETRSFSETDVQNGYCSFDDIDGKYGVRTAFKTDYGIIFSEMSSIYCFKPYHYATFKYGKGKYKIEKDEVFFISPTNKRMKKFSIPNFVNYQGNKYPVVAIMDNAFRNNKKLKSISIGNNIRVIGKGTFRNCKKLDKITGGKSVVRIGSAAFMNCRSLKKITIGENVFMIGKSAFRGCRNLKTIKFSGKKIKAIGKWTFKRIKPKAKFLCPSIVKSSYKKKIVKAGAPKTCRYMNWY